MNKLHRFDFSAIFFALCAILVAIMPELHAQETARIRYGDPTSEADERPFFEGVTRDQGLTSPQEFLGRSVGSRAAHHIEVVRYLRQLASTSDRARYDVIGATHEGRELGRFVVSSRANMERLDEILEIHAALRDPRERERPSAEVLQRTPVIAWMSYSIHGDEMSGTDASLALAWHLTSAVDDNQVQRILDRVVVVIDPCMNPDGRERILSQLEQSAGYVPNPEYDGMHRGRWPWGRGNHYLFDMNRDWLPGTQPETRARWKAVLEFPPQLFVDAHEMSGLDTYLFSPPRPPLNAQLPESNRSWLEVFSREQGAAFDAFGWSYYTREWFESWYPGYSDAWGALNGAVGILYEQAGYQAQPVRRASGEIATYRDAVHHQLVSSFANLTTLATNARPILEEYAARRAANVDAEVAENQRTFCLPPSALNQPGRIAFLMRSMLGQGIEVSRAKEAFAVSNVVSSDRESHEELELPAGTILIHARQPQGPLVKTYLDFDPRLDEEVLTEERAELERERSSKIYDVTAWSLPQALGLVAYWGDRVEVASEAVLDVASSPTGVAPPSRGDQPVYGLVVDGEPDSSVVFAAAAMSEGLQVNIADKSFRAAGRNYPRGSLLIRAHENEDATAKRVARAAKRSGAFAFAVNGGRSTDEGPDLGGGHFHLLHRPRIAVLSNAPVSTSEYGQVWHALDVDLKVPFTALDAASFGRVDLRRYDVLVLPPGGGRIVSEAKEKLSTWVRGGGTLIAMGSSASAVASKESGLSKVRLRRNALDELEAHTFAVSRERAARDVKGRIDLEQLFEYSEAQEESNENPDEPEESASVDPDAERADAWARLFSPQGAHLRGEVDDKSWLTFGCGAELPVYYEGSNAFLASHPVRVPVRLADPTRVRLSGLLWPEARERVADSAYATVEGMGRGQVVLFATSPVFRGWYKGTQRLFSNAVVYGPGLGADPVR